MYQLRDGSYLKLAFSIVVGSDKIDAVAQIIDKEMPGRLPASITMLLGNKGREELINGTYKREAFARELKKLLEERVFEEFQRDGVSLHRPKSPLEAREFAPAN